MLGRGTQHQDNRTVITHAENLSAKSRNCGRACSTTRARGVRRLSSGAPGRPEDRRRPAEQEPAALSARRITRSRTSKSTPTTSSARTAATTGELDDERVLTCVRAASTERSPRACSPTGSRARSSTAMAKSASARWRRAGSLARRRDDVNDQIAAPRSTGTCAPTSRYSRRPSTASRYLLDTAKTGQKPGR